MNGMDSFIIDSMQIMPEDAFLLMIVLVIVFAVVGAAALVNYLFRAIGLMGIAKKNGVPNGWMAFIPYANQYLEGDLLDKVTLGEREYKNVGIWNLVLPIAVNVLTSLILVAWICVMVAFGVFSDVGNFAVSYFAGIIIFAVAVTILQSAQYAVRGVIRYNIHKKYVDANTSVIHMILGLFVPLYQSIYYFILRKQEPVQENAVSDSSQITD